MANDVYVFETLHAAGLTTITDDGSGEDTIIVTSNYLSSNGAGDYSSRIFLDRIGSNVPGDGAWVETKQVTPSLIYRSLTFIGTIENARGGGGTDLLWGNGVANELQGDPLDEAGAHDDIYGFGGDDLLIGGGGSDLLEGGDDNDTLFGDYDPFAQPSVNLAAGDDVLNGGGGDDILAGNEGNNTYSGGDGFDTVDYGVFQDLQAASYRVDCNLETQLSTVYYYDYYSSTEYAVATDRIYPIEKLIGTGGDDTIKGQDNYSFGLPGSNMLLGGLGNDAITGGQWNDKLFGEAGNDTLDDGLNLGPDRGYPGFDELTGGPGDDTYVINMATALIFESAGGGYDRIHANTSMTIAPEVEELRLLDGASTGSATGDGAANKLFGNVYDNTLSGEGGSDTLDGGGGGDLLRGGFGNDTYVVGNTGVTITEFFREGYDTVNTTLPSFTLAAHVERVNYTGAGNFVGTGNNLDNRFQSGVGDDRFVDVAGGADIFSGGGGTDTLDFRTSATGATLNFITNVHSGAAAGDSYSSIEKFLGSNTAKDTMTAGGTGRFVFVGGGGNDVLTGGIKNDQLLGQVGQDTLIGGADRDSLDGGTGNDTLTGGTQGDVFVFIDAAFGQDTITDYEDGLDSFKVLSTVADDVSDFTITGNGTTSVLLTLNAAPANFITINGAAAITITAADFVFY